MIFLLIACGSSTSSNQGSEQNPDAILYSGLKEGATWTYRDDGVGWDDTGYDLDDGTLIKASHLGEGRIELRRGLRWADGESIGEIQISDTDGLKLEGWNLSSGSGNGDYPFSEAQIVSGETISGDWDCAISRPEEGISTYYADYENAFSFQCNNGGLAGTWSFALDVGLIRFEGDNGDFLELVAPW